MFFATIVFNLISSYLLASIGGSILIMFLTFFALIILNVEILSLFSAIQNFNLFIFSIFNLIFSICIFKYKKCSFIKPSFDFKRLKNALLLDKSLIVLSVAFISLTLISFFLATIMPVLEPDSQTYHFYRVYMFSAQKSLAHFETGDIRALIMPINSEIFYTWMLSFKKNFYGYGILSFCSFFLAIFSMWGIFEKFKFAFRKRLYAIFIFSSLSAIIIQIPSLQTDVTVGAFLLLAFYLFINKSNYFSSLSLAILMGIKSTGVVALFGFFVAIILYKLLIEKTKDFSQIKSFILFLILNFFIFSSYNYFLNFFHYHNPLGNRASLIGHGFWGGIKGYIANLIHFAFQSLDFTGFKWGVYLNETIFNLKNQFFNLIHISPITGCNVSQKEVNYLTDEQTVGFGILGFLVYLPMIFVSIAKYFKNKSKNKKITLCFIFAVAFLINILVLARTVAYMVYSIRFVVAFVCFSSIILIGVYRRKDFIKPIIFFFCLFNMFLIPAHNARMPFWQVLVHFSDENFDKIKFEKRCYKGHVVPIMNLANTIANTIETKYKDKKNIAFVKTLSSTALYLKRLNYEGFNIDIIKPETLSSETIKKYDLIVLEGKEQNSNTHRPEDVEPKYEVIDNNIIFNSPKDLNCYYTYIYHKKNPYIDEAVEQYCFTYDFLHHNPIFKLDFEEKFTRRNKQDIVNIYYYINQIND